MLATLAFVGLVLVQAVGAVLIPFSFALGSLPRAASLHLTVFLAAFLFRYLRLIVNIWAYATFKPRPLAARPRFRSSDVTVVVPTVFDNAQEIVRCLNQILGCAPNKVILVTAQGKVNAVSKCIEAESFHGVEVIGVSKLNKRRQMIAALKEVTTELVVFADDDVFWPENYLHYLLACFEDAQVGAAGTRQRVRRNPNPNFWNFLGICYLERRNFNTGATNNIDGGISTLSGRTSAWRTSILKNEEFYYHFMNDSWFGHPLNTDDDKCLTRWCYSTGWKIHLQFDDNAVLETTLEDNPKFLHQCVRWARAHWRGNLTVMTNNTYWYREHLWTLYAIYIAQFQTPALIIDGLLFWLLHSGVQPFIPLTQTLSLTIFSLWVLFTKIVKLIPHLRRHPEDIVFLPIAVLFSYLHGFINVYAALTLHVTIWGSKKLDEEEKAPRRVKVPFLQLPEDKTGLEEPGVVLTLIDPAVPTPALQRGNPFDEKRD